VSHMDFCRAEAPRSSSPRIFGGAKALLLLSVLALFVWIPKESFAMTAQEILEEVVKQNFQESFRVVLTVTTSKNKKSSSEHTLWFMGRTRGSDSDFFIEFDGPKDTKGLRFLMQIAKGQEPKAFMHLPATGKTVALALDDPSMDLGGTGLTMDDIQGFVPGGGETAAILKEEKIEGRDCYVVKVTVPQRNEERMLWITKQGFLVVRTQQVDSAGKVRRIFRVLDFFKTEKGNEFPREEEITIPDKDFHIKVRQEHAVFGVELPDEIMDPEKFGTFQWRN
jgi:hypothetical protein